MIIMLRHIMLIFFNILRSDSSTPSSALSLGFSVDSCSLSSVLSDLNDLCNLRIACARLS